MNVAYSPFGDISWRHRKADILSNVLVNQDALPPVGSAWYRDNRYVALVKSAFNLSVECYSFL